MGRTQIGFPGNRGNVPFFVGGISNVHTYLAEERKIFILSPFVPTGMNLSGWVSTAGRAWGHPWAALCTDGWKSFWRQWFWCILSAGWYLSKEMDGSAGAIVFRPDFPPLQNRTAPSHHCKSAYGSHSVHKQFYHTGLPYWAPCWRFRRQSQKSFCLNKYKCIKSISIWAPYVKTCAVSGIKTTITYDNHKHPSDVRSILMDLGPPVNLFSS